MSPPVLRSAAFSEDGGALELQWADGHAGRYEFPYLRGLCPCAACRTERTEARTNPFRVLSVVASQAATRLIKVDPVGRYAISITWGDGHSTGIYSFEYLREICPCPECGGGDPDQRPFVHGIHIPK